MQAAHLLGQQGPHAFRVNVAESDEFATKRVDPVVAWHSGNVLTLRPCSSRLA